MYIQVCIHTCSVSKIGHADEVIHTYIYSYIYIYARMRIPPGRTQLRATSPTTPEAALGIQGYAFAQSVKLAVFETIVDASIEKVGNHGLVDRFFPVSLN